MGQEACCTCSHSFDPSNNSAMLVLLTTIRKQRYRDPRRLPQSFLSSSTHLTQSTSPRLLSHTGVGGIGVEYVDSVLPDVRIPEQEERRLPKQCNSQKKGSLLLTRIRAPAARSTQWYRVREP